MPKLKPAPTTMEEHDKLFSDFLIAEDIRLTELEQQQAQIRLLIADFNKHLPQLDSTGFAQTPTKTLTQTLRKHLIELANTTKELAATL